MDKIFGSIFGGLVAGGKNIFATVAKVLVFAAGLLASFDENKTGNDDLAAGALLAVASGLEAYAEKDNNEHGNIVDGLIAGLTEYREQMVNLGKITAFNQGAEVPKN